MSETKMSAGDWAKRLMKSQKLNAGSPYLRDDQPPTPQQVCAVLHALADHTLLMHMNADWVLGLGADRAHLGDGWQAATGQGRFLQAMGDWLEITDPAVQVEGECQPNERGAAT